MSIKKAGSRWLEEPSSPAEEEAKVNELRTALGQLTGRSLLYASDACLKRYLRARNWNVKKAEKMLRDSLAWRAKYKPEEIRWEEVAEESRTGKTYRANFVDKQGHTVLVLHPGRQNTTARDGQLRQLVYTMESAVLNLPPGQEQMVWLVDFKGWTTKKSVPIRTVQETAHILQNYYPERLGTAILYNPPRIFEAFWVIVSPFLDPKTFHKVKFVYSKNAESMKLLHELLDLDKVEASLGENDFNYEEYANLMQQDDTKSALMWKVGAEVNDSNIPDLSALKIEPPAALNGETVAASA